MVDNILFSVAIILLTGLLFSKLAKVCRFPDVTGYLIGGLLVGPSLLGLVSEEQIHGLSIISDVALGFIAVSIGANFKVSYFKKVGVKPIIIAVCEALFASVFVFGAVMLYSAIAGPDSLGGKPIVFALVLSAIAAATAPAATLLVIKQYKARGEVTENLLSVVAIDDAVALAIYGFNVTFALSIYNGSSSGNIALSILMPFIEIIISLLIGIILGVILVLLVRWFKGRSNRICAVIVTIFFGIAIDQIINNAFEMHTSTLLTCMMLGATLVNFSNKYNDIANLIDRFTPPIYMSFFVLSGAELNIRTIASIGVIGIVYVTIRVFGKYIGAWFGSKVSKSGEKTKKYLGWCLVPQAGVALGLSSLAAVAFGVIGVKIRTIILCATLIYELVGPFIVKLTLTKAGEIKTE